MITIYTKPGCPACVGTMRYLERHGLDYRIVNVTKDWEAWYYVASLGYTSLPVVVTGDGHWCGLRIDRLNALVTNVNDNAVIEP